MSSLSQADHKSAPRYAVVACGALATHVAQIARRRSWAVDVYPLPPLLHNQPLQIAGEVAAKVAELRNRYGVRVAVGYADCGTYGALDEVCAREGLARLGGNHCYDVFAGEQDIADIFAAVPGTYLLTDFLVRSFHRSVVVELGLDRHPELRDAYFRHYTRVVWLAQRQTAELIAAAEAAAAALALPLEIVLTGDARLERELERLIVG